MANISQITLPNDSNVYDIKDANAQEKLTAGTNITISSENVISAADPSIATNSQIDALFD